MSGDLTAEVIRRWEYRFTRTNSVEHVRRRPAMYVGDMGALGCYHLAIQIIDNAVEEVRKGHGSRVGVEILRCGGLLVWDEGEGIAPLSAEDEDALERLREAQERWQQHFDLHGTLDDSRLSYPFPPRNLFGLGLIATSALSSRLVVEVRREGFRRRQTFSRGLATSSLENFGPTTKTGTTITLWPDPQIFSCLDFDMFRLQRQIEEFAMLLPRLQVRLTDHRVTPPRISTIHWPDGLLDGLDLTSRGLYQVHPTPIHGSAQEGETRISIAFQWYHTDMPRIWSLCNGQTTPEDGTHVSGFYRGVTHTIHRAMPDVRRAPDEQRRRTSSAGEDLRSGIVAIVSVDSPDPCYNSATKDKVNNDEFDRLTAALSDRLLTAFLAAHPDEARAIAEHLEAPPTIDPKTGR